MRVAVGDAVILVSLVMAAWTALAALLNKGVGVAQLLGLVTLELVVLVHAVVAGVDLATGERAGQERGALVVGYLLTAVLVLPAAYSWSYFERSRWSTLVLTVACLVLPVLVVRVEQVWAAGG